MNIVDIIIILLVLFGAFLGFKRGFTRELASFLGFIVVIVLAFLFKNPLSVFFYEHLPFFSFSGFFKGISILNILVYEIIAFLLLVFLFSIILKVVLLITGLFEKILSFTVILGIPSKILGMIVGALEFFVYGFIFLFVFSLPWFDVPEIKESKFRDDILNNTPKHLHKIRKYQSQHLFKSNAYFIKAVLDTLLNNNLLKKPTPNEAKSICTLIVSNDI